MHDIHIIKAGAERIADLEPFVEALHVHYEMIASPLLGPRRSFEQVWNICRHKYETWLSQKGSFLLFALQKDKPVGCAIIYLADGSIKWQTAESVAFLELLTVLPQVRNRGIGTALMDALYEELRLSGIGHLTLQVISTNTDAFRFYERFGLVPKLIEMMGTVHPRAAN
ncbi:MAG TPA: GNAT family N-acetyltransferase [Ktedonobacteraceae bacterium]